MTTLQNLLDDVRTRLNDAGDTQVTKTNKILMVNHGLRAMYPSLYAPKIDISLTLAADTYSYDIPASLQPGRLLNVEFEEPTTTRYQLAEDFGYTYRVVQTGTDAVSLLEFDQKPETVLVGQTIRLSVAKPFTVLVNDADVTDCPGFAIEAPVLYAMGLATSIPLDDRLDYTRYSTTAANNAIFPRDIMEVSQFWFAQFASLLDAHRMPVPGAGF